MPIFGPGTKTETGQKIGKKITKLNLKPKELAFVMA
jgi:hypothetical protein